MAKRRKRPREQTPAEPAPAAPPPPPDPERGWPGALAIAALAALLYAGTVTHGYVLDDLQVVEENPAVQEHRAWEAVSDSYWPSALQTDASNWRPLATLLWCAEDGRAESVLARSPRTAPAVAAGLHHAHNAFLHGLVTLVLFAFARRLLGCVRGAWVVAALFAVHPAHTEAVAPVVGRTDLLAALGALVMLEAWCRYACDRAPARWLAVAMGGLLVGVGGKESAAPLVVALPLAERWIGGRPWGEIARAWRGYAVVAGACLAYAIARTLVLGAHSLAHGNEPALGALGRLAFAGRNTVISMGLLVAPVRFHHLITTVPSDAPYTYAPPAGVWLAVWPLFALPVWAGWAWLRPRSPRGAFCWVAALLAWFPTSGLLPAGAGTALRYLFLPSAFAACGAVLGARAIVAARPAARGAVLTVAATWAIAAFGLTLARLPAWRSNRTLYESVLRESPGCYTATYGLGAWIATRDRDTSLAREWFERALAIAGRNERGVAAWMNVAQTYEWAPLRGERYGAGADLPRALQEYEAILAVVPDAPAAHLNAGVVCEKLGRHADALHHFDRLIAGQAVHPDLHAWQAKAAELAWRLGRPAEARERFRVAAATAGSRGRMEFARSYLSQALVTGPPADDAARIAAELAALGG